MSIYSDEERKMLGNSIHEIEKYICENYIPLLEACERVSVRFGERDEYLLVFGSDDILYINDSRTYSLRHGHGRLDVYEFPDNADELVLQWGSVKVRIRAYFENRAKRKQAIRDFKI